MTAIRLAIVLAVSQLAVTVAARPATQRLLDRVAARVNNEIITENELLLAAFGDVRQSETLLPGTMPDVRATLNAMIGDRLIAQKAREQIKDIPTEIIANRVEQVIKDRRATFPTEPAFVQALEARGWDLVSYKQFLQRQEERTFVVQAALAQRVNITDDDVRAFTDELKRKGQSTTQYRLLQILAALPSRPSADEIAKAENRMVGILEHLRQGVPFDQLAREQSDDKATKLGGGDLGWIAEKDLQRPILDAVAPLEKGQISKPVRTDKGVHVFQLLRKKTAREMLFEKRIDEVRKTWAAELRRRAQVKILLPELQP